MGVIHLDNVEDRIVDTIKLRADMNGRSFEDEVLAVLRDATAAGKSPAERAAEADRIRSMTKGYDPETDSVAVIREMRDRGR